MSEIQQNRWDQLLRRSAGLIGGGSKVNDALSELFPTMEVERVTAENLKLAGWNSAHGSTTLTAAAAQFPLGQVLNPADSGAIVVVEQIIISPGTTMNCRWGVDTTVLLSAIGSGRFRDSRNGLLTAPVGQVRGQSSVGAPPSAGTIASLLNVANKISDENGIAVLSPGFGLTVGGVTTASTINITFFWRERPALESELSF